MTTKTKLTVTDSHGETFTRTTAKPYRFVVIHRATEGWVREAEANLQGAIEFRANLTAEQIERAPKQAEKAHAMNGEAIRAGDWTAARKHSKNAQIFRRRADIDAEIERHRGYVERNREQVGAVLDTTWTTRIDLAQKHAAKHGGIAAAEIVEIA